MSHAIMGCLRVLAMMVLGAGKCGSRLIVLLFICQMVYNMESADFSYYPNSKLILSTTKGALCNN